MVILKNVDQNSNRVDVIRKADFKIILELEAQCMKFVYR